VTTAPVRGRRARPDPAGMGHVRGGIRVQHCLLTAAASAAARTVVPLPALRARQPDLEAPPDQRRDHGGSGANSTSSGTLAWGAGPRSSRTVPLGTFAPDQARQTRALIGQLAHSTCPAGGRGSPRPAASGSTMPRCSAAWSWATSGSPRTRCGSRPQAARTRSTRDSHPEPRWSSTCATRHARPAELPGSA